MVRKSSSNFRQQHRVKPVLTFAAIATVLFSSGAIRSVAAADVSISETPPATYPADIVSDWKAQDGTAYDQSITKIKAFILTTTYPELADKITGTGEAGYLQACHYRRIARMKRYSPELKRIIYAKHHDIGGAIIGYTEDLKGDGVQGLGSWGFAGMSRSDKYGSGGNSGIYLLEFNDYYPAPQVVIEDKTGVLRDPCASYDGKYLVYAHSKDNNGYHICDFDFATKKSRQLTDNLGTINVSDYEPCVLPSGDIVFSSSRCFGHVDCNVNITSNIFIVNKDGKYMRRLGYDQVNTFYPTTMEDGTIMYTRWEYNDRNVANVFGVFTMFPDGSHQNEWFGNQTEWPATFNQARIIPGSKGRKALATIGGHQGGYNGDLVIIDASKGRNNTKSVNCTDLIAPRRTKASGGGAFDMNGVPAADKKFQNPYPLGEEYFLVSYRKTTSEKFNVYLMDFDGNRELVAWDATKSVSQPISLIERAIPNAPQYQADYKKTTAVVSIADVYYGMASKGITAGSIKKVRAVAMEYRTDPAFGNTGNSSYQMTPVGRFGGSWEAKWIVGESPIESDGSASFELPANTPIFLQLIADNGTCSQTMRSWMTLKPGEKWECVGCHEDKNESPPVRNPKATAGNAKKLEKFYELSGEKGSFYFPKVIQPVLDANCVKSGCHDDSHTKLKLTSKLIWTNDLSDEENKGAYRYWTTGYYNLSQSKYVNCNAIFGSASPITPKSIGSSRSAVITKLLGGHVKDLPADVIPKLAAWIDLSIPHSGTYTDDMKPADAAKYLERVARRDKQEAYEQKNIEEWVAAGQYEVAPYATAISVPPVSKQTAVDNNMLSARFNALGNMLSVAIPSDGTIRILDLQGRQILAKTISREAFAESAIQNIKLSVSSGTYIVKFDGMTVSSEKVISLL